MKQFILVCVFILNMLSSHSVFALGCEHSRNIEREVAIDDFESLTVLAGAGELVITGGELESIQIKARLCASKEGALTKMDVIDSIQSGELIIQTKFVEESSWLGERANATIDLELIVPQRLNLVVKDSSGAARLSKLESLTMTDSSGGLEIDNIAGDVDVIDSSGSLEINDVGGNVSIADSSGGIEVSDVKQNLVVTVDSSGGIDARRIGGSVLVKADSSGHIRVRTVSGDFTVGSNSSGGITHEGVGGKISLPQRR